MSNDKTIAFVTGGNRGLGFETARELGEKGITVVIGSRDAAKGDAAAKKLRDAGHDVRSIKFDVLSVADYQAAYDYFDKEFGRLDILVNNAGIASGGDGMDMTPTSQTTPETLHQIFETNFFAVVAITQKLLPLIKKSKAGRIGKLSSVLGSLTLHSTPGSPIYDFKLFAYNASKTALNAFTVHLAYELKDTTIKVNSAHPGWVKTDMGGENAPMEVSEGGKTSAQLATLSADGATGGFFHDGETLPW